MYQHPIDLLNLACIKYTGVPLPVSDFASNNWKYELDEQWCDVAGSILTKKAKWSPHPYFNPLHLYYPSYDFGVRVMRTNLVDELQTWFDVLSERKQQEIQEKVLEQFNKENPYFSCQVIVRVRPTTNSFDDRQGKLRFMLDPIVNDRGREQFAWAVDREIMRKKLKRLDLGVIITAGDTVLRKPISFEVLYYVSLIKIGMSYNRTDVSFPSAYTTNNFGHCPSFVWDNKFLPNELVRDWKLRSVNSKDYYKNWIVKHQQKLKTELSPADCLTPEDYIRIYNPQGYNKTEKINKALIANFPTP
jgi:hypothetical protein